MLVARLVWRIVRSRRDGVASVVVWFSLIGIALGVATLIVVMSVMNGFRHDLVNRIIGLDGHINITGRTGLPENDPNVITLMRSDPGAITPAPGSGDPIDGLIDSVSPHLNGQVIARSREGRFKGVLLRGVTRAGLEARSLLAQSVSQADPDTLNAFERGEGLLVGDLLADQLQLQPGDFLSMVAPVFDQTAFGSFPRELSLPIIGSFSVGMSEYDSNVVFVPLSVMQRFFNLEGVAEGFDVFISNPDHAPKVAQAILTHLDQQTPLGYRVLPWQQSNATLTAALVIERNVMFLILSLIILVAAFNILTGQTMLVNSRLRSIAILRGIGLTVRQILMIFILCGAVLGTAGTIVGAVMGVLLANNLESIRLFLQSAFGLTLFDARVYFLRAIPSTVDWSATLVVIGVALLLSLLFALIPALRAARTDPALILRD